MKRALTILPTGNLAFLLLTVFGAAKGFALVPILFRLLGEEGYGTYVLVASTIGYGTIFALLGLDAAYYRFAPTQREKPGGVRGIFNAIALACLIWNAILVVIVCAVAALSGRAGVSAELLISGAVIVAATGLFGIAAAEFRVREKILSFCGLVILFQALEFSALLVGAFLHGEIEKIFSLMAVCDLTVAIILLGLRWFSIGFVRPVAPDIRKVLGFGVHSILSQAVNSGFLVLDKYLLTVFAGVAALAHYGVAFAISASVLQVVGIIALVVPTRFARAFDRQDPIEQAEVLSDGFRQFAALAVPAVFGIVYVGAPLITLMTSAAIAVQGYPIAVILAFAFLAAGCARVLVIALRTAGDQTFVSSVLAGFLGVFAVVSILALSAAQAPGLAVAGAMMLVSLGQFGFLIWRMRAKGIPNGLRVALWWKPVVGAAVMGIPMIWISIVDVPTLVASILSAIAVYAGAMYLLGRR